MPRSAFLWILAALVASGLLVWFQYYYKTKPRPWRNTLALLRFLAVFGILLLLVNPEVEKLQTYLTKTKLLFLADNSASIDLQEERQAILRTLSLLEANPDLQDRFEIQNYLFGKSLRVGDSLDFTEGQTDISAALESLSRVHNNEKAVVVLLTDGNLNSGSSQWFSANPKLDIYPVVIGDTTTFSDLRIDRIIANKYAFEGNKYPVEILYSYTGQAPAEVSLQITDNGRPVYRNRVSFPAGGGSGQRELLLDAGKPGLHILRASLTSLDGERNLQNNSATAGIEVLDEQLQIGLVSTETHPDIGSLRRSLTQNQQRQLDIMSPNAASGRIEETDLWIFYQPDASFAPLYRLLKNKNTPIFWFCGPEADWNFVNSVQQGFQLEERGPAEEVFAELNAGFGYFDVSAWKTEDFPPVEGLLGSYDFTVPNEWILGQRVKGISLEEPLLALLKGSDRRQAVFFGSGLWKWRMATFKSERSFESFDGLISKVVQFLTADAVNQRLAVEYEPIYRGAEESYIRARYFDEAYSFDPGASLVLKLRDSSGTAAGEFPMSLGKDIYQTDISFLDPGKYSFTVELQDGSLRQSGSFSLQRASVEQQPLPSDVDWLSKLALENNGSVIFPDRPKVLTDSLLSAERYRPVQKSRRNIVSLLEYYWLMALILAAFAAEWFIRKYNGLL
ncbi:vWA domain-containing protein [Robiginitalea sp. IMCC44478]|uniref:vWA domain-containing protein n=1 Tax=Robiginitalea sp. IMCC44478 TaxID=3459122 RepID=UPI00404289CC